MKYSNIVLSPTQGATGLQGIIGPQGITGPQGISGIQGVSNKYKGFHNILPPTSGDIIPNALIVSGTASSALTINRVYAYPFIPSRDTSYSAICTRVNTFATSTNCRLLIYSDLNGKPNSKLYESTSISCATIGLKTATTSGTLSAGVIYWLAIYVNSASIQFQSYTQNQMLNVGNDALLNSYTGYYVDATFGSAPATFGAGTLFQTPNVLVGIKIT